jgi:hypothetical protein
MNKEAVAKELVKLAKSLTAKTELKLVRKSETDEWVVKVYIDGKYDEGKSYYTDDKKDAENTMAQMKKEMGITAGRSYAVRYTISTNKYRVYPGHGYTTDAEWKSGVYGRPTPQNIKQYIEKFNASLESGGVNSAIGRGYAVYGAEIVDQMTKEVIAQWEDRGIIQFYKSKPMFEMIGKDRTAIVGSRVFLQSVIGMLDNILRMCSENIDGYRKVGVDGKEAVRSYEKVYSMIEKLRRDIATTIHESFDIGYMSASIDKELLSGQDRSAARPLTLYTIRPRHVIIRNKIHPEWGTWTVLEEYSKGIWEIQGDRGVRVLNDAELHEWEIVD